MAKSDDKGMLKKEVYKYPSRFGSHSTMVNLSETKKLSDPAMVVCEDEFGMYITEPKCLDTGLADPNRCIWAEDRERKFKEIMSQIFHIV